MPFGLSEKSPGASLMRAASVAQSNVRAQNGSPVIASQNCVPVSSVASAV